ncbi:MAG: hypothetical protein C0504_11285 [Candidatus Solibacter sp.]|nr:hypothetical protein [Candidatus Solibacter sp.]
MMIAATVSTVSSAGLAGALALYWSLKREIAAHGRRLRSDREQTIAAVELLRATISRMETELAAARHDAPRFAPPAQSPPAGLSMNLSKRTQALRMHRRGEPLEQIASVLGIPRREVELLIKVQNAVRFGVGASA